MAYWHMTPKVARHAEIGDDETVLHACYGLSADFVAFSNIAASGGASVMRNSIENLSPADLWRCDFAGESGHAAPLTKTGVLALTNRRLIYFQKSVVVGRPKKILATWPIEQLSAAVYHDKVLGIRFSDGSIGGLHVPPSQKPGEFLKAFENVIGDSPDNN